MVALTLALSHSGYRRCVHHSHRQPGQLLVRHQRRRHRVLQSAHWRHTPIRARTDTARHRCGGEQPCCRRRHNVVRHLQRRPHPSVGRHVHRHARRTKRLGKQQRVGAGRRPPRQHNNRNARFGRANLQSAQPPLHHVRHAQLGTPVRLRFGSARAPPAETSLWATRWASPSSARRHAR